MDKKPPKTKKEKIPEKDNDVSNSSSVSVSGPTIPQRPYKLGINILNEKHIFFCIHNMFLFYSSPNFKFDWYKSPDQKHYCEFEMIDCISSSLLKLYSTFCCLYRGLLS